jgi:uncharacterized membrane protein YoaK (UPF0700 family)
MDWLRSCMRACWSPPLPNGSSATRPRGASTASPARTWPSGAPTSEPKSTLVQQWLAHPQHGPLPVLLLMLTVNTGVVDAVSILSLGRVFVANMTGNVVFVGFAAAGAPGFSLSASLWALGGFVAGAYIGGLLIRRIAVHRGRLFSAAMLIETVTLVVALVISVTGGHLLSTAEIDAVAASAAIGLGMQNAVVRHLAVPDLTTTVLTMTLTGIAADVFSANHTPAAVRRVAALLAMLGGAVVGALVVLHQGRTAGLAVALALVAVTAAAAVIAARGSKAWHSPAGA